MKRLFFSREDIVPACTGYYFRKEEGTLFPFCRIGRPIRKDTGCLTHEGLAERLSILGVLNICQMAGAREQWLRGMEGIILNDPPTISTPF